MKTLTIINIILGVINSIIGFITGNIPAGLGWGCSVCGWVVVLIKEIQLLNKD